MAAWAGTADLMARKRKRWRGVHAVVLHVGAVDATTLEASRKTGVPVPVHTPLWAPEHEPTLKATIGGDSDLAGSDEAPLIQSLRITIMYLKEELSDAPPHAPLSRSIRR